jgi:serine/threonine protein kinase
MAAPATIDEFIDLVRKSGVADEKRLDSYLAKMRADMPADPPKAAGLLVHNGILTNFQAENILQGKWRRFSIGKYKVLERLGSGGFAQVYLCEHKLMRRRVAVKVLPVAKAKDSSALERFYREARAVAALDHPNIVHAYDIDQDEDLHFLVMEYVDGANLQEIVKRSGPLSVLRACHYIRQAALALQHAHEQGLVHRDIKPGNILVDRTGVVKVLDMGLALFFLEEDEQLTKKHDDGTLGTADYLSPEQAMDSHDVDIRTDIYSLGVTFYFLLAGRAPFEGMQIAQKLLAQQMKQPKPVSDYRKDVPAGVLAILDKMMAKKADLRYAVPGDVADALVPFTQTAIAPPAEAEMPRLSPAATGQAVGDSETTVGKNDTPVTAPRTAPGSGSGSGSGKKVPAVVATAPAPSSGAGKAKAAPAAPMPMATTTAPPISAPAELPDDPAWNPFATDTASPASTEDAAPKSGRGANRKNASRNNRIVIAVLILAFVVVPVFLTVVISGLIWFFYPTQTPPAKTGPPKLEVSRASSGKNIYPSIQAALRNAEIGSVIELTDEVYEENIVIEPGPGRRTNITLQAVTGKEIVWRSAANDPNQPILKLSKAGDFKFKGKGITFDGTLDKKRQVNDLMMITLDCTGLVVEDVSFKNFARSALFVINGAGSANQPIKLLRLTTDAGDKPRPAIYFDANPKVLPPLNDYIDIEDGDFRGIDPAKAIQIKANNKDGKIVGKNVNWPGR